MSNVIANPAYDRCSSLLGCKSYTGIHLRPRFLPRGPKHSLNDRHVPYGIFERNRWLTTLAHRLGEQVALNCVLVANFELFGSHTTSKHIGAVVDEDAARPVGGRVDRDLHFDAPARAQDLHTLIRDHLCAAGKHGLPRWKIEHRGRQ